MIKDNKKNKIITFLCACLMVCASALGLVQAVGTTLASSPTAYNVTTSTFDYKNENFLNQFDFYFSNIGNGVGFSTSITINITLYNMDGTISNFLISDGAVAGGNWPGLSFIYTLSNNAVISDNCGSNYSGTQQRLVIGSSSSTPNINFSNLINFDFLILNLYDTSTGLNYLLCNERLVNFHKVYYDGKNSVDTSDVYNQGVSDGQNNVLNNPNAYGLYTQAQYQQNYTDGYNAGITQGQNNVINNPNDFGLNTNQQLQDSYNQGFADGEQSSDAYQNGYDTGYTDGSNEVLNNPNNYNLYTQAQYEQNYTDGYNQGLATARYGSFGSYDGFLSIRSNTSIDGVPTYVQRYNKEQSFVYSGSTVIINPTLLSTLSEEPEYYQIGIGISFNNPFTYSDKTALNFVNNYLLSRYLIVDYTLSDIDNNAYVCSYIVTPIYDSENNLVDYNVVNTVPSNVYGKVINGLFISTTNNVEQLSKIAFSQNSIEYKNGFEAGYLSGTNSDIVNSAYDKGYDKGAIDGFNSGYAQGLANQDNATFASMISAVIDVPINSMRNLFNFELLGINLFGFFTALFTLLVVITIIRLILGGK